MNRGQRSRRERKTDSQTWWFR